SWQRHADATWAPRMWHGAAVHQNRIWVTGGHSQAHGNFGDTWTSEDGEHWAQVETAHHWSPRHEHSLLAHDGALWALGGYADELTSEVWRLAGDAPE